jgi:hypothetical protein
MTASSVPVRSHSGVGPPVVPLTGDFDGLPINQPLGEEVRTGQET